VLQFARVREAEVGGSRASIEPGDELSADELGTLIVGFKMIRDQEPLDDVGNWANAVLALLEDERHRSTQS
jgi:hypothetical protein